MVWRQIMQAGGRSKAEPLTLAIPESLVTMRVPGMSRMEQLISITMEKSK